MNWEAVGALAELLGALVVLATLVYLAVQVRHSRDLLEENRKIALSEVYANRSDQRLQDLRHGIDSPYVARILGEELGQSEDQMRARMVFQLMEIQMDTMHFQHKLGLLDQATIERSEKRTRENWDIWVKHGCYIHPYVQEWHDKNM